MELDWDYYKQTCRVSMQGYIANFLACYHHLLPSKPQLSPHKHPPISYGDKTQHPAEPDSSPPLDDTVIKRFQGIVGALL